MRHQNSTGSGQTIEELFEQHSEKLFAYLRQHTPSREDAEDILVDTFMAALSEAKFAHLPASGQVAWLWRVAHNKVVDAFRKAIVRRSLPLEQADETLCEEEARDPEQAALRQDEEREIHDLLQTLPELQQEVLRLRFAYDLRSAEIATILGKREDAVRAMLSRSMNTLRRLYAQNASAIQQSKPDKRPKNAEESDE